MKRVDFFANLSPVGKGLVSFAVLLPALYLLVLCGFVLMEDWLLYHRRSPELNETPADQGWFYEEVLVETSGGKSVGWWIPLEGARGAVLFSHGSGRNISHYLRDAALYRDCGFSVLIYDYGGYGNSEGSPSEKRCYEDGLAFYKHLLDDRGFDPQRIVLAGASLGSGITTRLAVEQLPGAMILEAAFTSFPDAVVDAHWASRLFLPRLVLRNRYANLTRVKELYCPVLVVHSRDDKTIPFAHGEALYAAAAGPKRFLPLSGSHGGGKFSAGALYTETLCAFLSEHIPE
jgi:fermentation-respiration switch protein FrsA (DUF1100 family)